jgi:uncharacterized protein (DUF885 family)
MNSRIETPFDTIENAQEYLRLLAETIAENKKDIENEITIATSQMSDGVVQALRMVEYNLEKLQRHLVGSSRALNDLRSLRRLLLQERRATNDTKPDHGAKTPDVISTFPATEEPNDAHPVFITRN